MSRKTEIQITPEEYLALERRAEYKSEYFEGAVFAMTGASREHNLITTNLVRELSQALRTRPCEVYGGDMRVRIPGLEIYTYPDVTVACDQPVFEDESVDTLLNPQLIVEVLSKSTASYDRIQKFAYYRTINSLTEYLLVAQDAYRVEQYVKRTDGRWLVTDIISRESKVELASVPCVLELKDIYEKVSFD
jgi:Uma2 family endonuclease